MAAVGACMQAEAAQQPSGGYGGESWGGRNTQHESGTDQGSLHGRDRRKPG